MNDDDNLILVQSRVVEEVQNLVKENAALRHELAFLKQEVCGCSFACAAGDMIPHTAKLEV